MKTIIAILTLKVPNDSDMALPKAARRLRVLKEVAELEVGGCALVYEVSPEEAEYERRCYEQDMTAAARM